MNQISIPIIFRALLILSMCQMLFITALSVNHFESQETFETEELLDYSSSSDDENFVVLVVFNEDGSVDKIPLARQLERQGSNFLVRKLQ